MLNVLSALALYLAANPHCQELDVIARRHLSREDATRYHAEAAGCDPAIKDALLIQAGGRILTVQRDARSHRILSSLSPPPPALPPRRQGAAQGPQGSGRTRLTEGSGARGGRTPDQTLPPRGRTRPAVAATDVVPPRRPIEPAVAPEAEPLEIEVPAVSNCAAPNAGWIVASESDGSAFAYASGPPSASPPGRPPNLNERVTFPDQRPALIFTRSLPCYSADSAQCETRTVSGTFVVTRRTWFNTGPRGAAEWWLCVQREGDSAS